MRFIASLALASSLASAVAAFPHMLRDLGVSMQEFEAIAKRSGPDGIRQLAQKRQSQIPVSIPLPAITIPGLPIPSVIDIPGVITVGVKAIPDAAHPFQAPGATDQRGGCPGLNIMSNYGYMSRNGIVSAGDIIYGCTEMLGYSFDLSAALVALAIRAGAMDITTLKMSIGGTDSRTNGPASAVLGPAPGLFDIKVHNKYEVDGSMAYDDSYFHRTQANSGSFFNGTRWAALQKIADANGGLFDQAFHVQHRYQAYLDCIATNPACTWNPVNQITFSNADTYTFLGMATTDPATGQITPPISASIQSFWGAQPSGDTFVHVPEKLYPGPDGLWYRRSTPLTTPELAANGVETYLQHPVVFGTNNGYAPNTFTPTLNPPNLTGPGALCVALNQITENDGALGSRFGIFASGVASVLSALVAPAYAESNCGGSS